MKNLVWIFLAAATLYFIHNNNNFVVPQQLSGHRTGNGISKHEFSSLFDQQRAFSDLAKNNYYTVIEVYLDSCAVCKRLEKGYDQFLDKRRDVIIRKVHFPETGINIPVTSPEMMEGIQSRIDSYQVCGTPHIEIYAPDRTLITADNCSENQGTDFLRHWISAETGIPQRTL